VDWWEPSIAVAGLLVGLVVGLTGMGGGALMTPILVFFFGVSPLAAVSSDVVASFFMKPIGGLVHLRHGSVHLDLVRWLCLGSVPGAFAGVLVLRSLGDGDQVQSFLLVALGAVLVLAAGAMAAKAYFALRERERRHVRGGLAGGNLAAGELAAADLAEVPVRRLPTVLIGAAGGMVVGLTSVGAGSIMIVSLLLLYPTIKVGQLVGTDLVQAVPLVASASLGHVLFGDFTLGVTGSILVGAIPGVWLGARVSSRTPGSLVRRALALIMFASGTKLLGASTPVVLLATGAVLVVGLMVWATIRARHGEDPFVWQQRRRWKPPADQIEAERTAA
jgi:uncharacterized membrane protein YfcA